MLVILAALGILGLYAWAQPGFSITTNNWLFSENSNQQKIETGSISRNIPIASNFFAPRSSALAVGVYDEASHFRLWGQDETTPYPIASITKLMTVMAFLDQKVDGGMVVEVTEADYRLGGKAHFFVGDQVTVNDLLRATLIASDNTAATALVRSTGLSEEEFVAKMNEKAEQLRLVNTAFVDPTGLESGNQAPAREVARLARKAFSEPLIGDIIEAPQAIVTTKAGKTVTLTSTNFLLQSSIAPGVRIMGGKTGSLPEAGYCFVALFSRNGHEIITVVLGASDDESRFNETLNLVRWAYEAYTW